MSFRDFLKYFGELEICHLAPESVDLDDADKKFEVFTWHGEWRRGVSAGGCGNRSDGGNRAFATNPQVQAGTRIGGTQIPQQWANNIMLPMYKNFLFPLQ